MNALRVSFESAVLCCTSHRCICQTCSLFGLCQSLSALPSLELDSHLCVLCPRELVEHGSRDNLVRGQAVEVAHEVCGVARDVEHLVELMGGGDQEASSLKLIGSPVSNPCKGVLMFALSAKKEERSSRVRFQCFWTVFSPCRSGRPTPRPGLPSGGRPKSRGSRTR